MINAAARRGIRLDYVLSRVTPIALCFTFVVVSADKFVVWAVTGHLGVDLRIYRAAAAAGLSGGNPWSVIVDGYYFAAPPTSLLPYVPAALMPVDVATVVYAVVFGAAAIAAVRALRCRCGGCSFRHCSRASSTSTPMCSSWRSCWADLSWVAPP